jgi:zinc transport system substrate-binding protein
MQKKMIFFLGILTAVILLMGSSSGYAEKAGMEKSKTHHTIVTSDTILWSMAVSLLPPNRYTVEAILPPGQCPGHYDLKLSDIEKIKKADWIIAFRGMPFLNQADLDGRAQLFVDANGRNWMAPDSYIYGLNRLADELSIRFPKDRNEISKRKETASHQVIKEANSLKNETRRAGFAGKTVIAAALQKEPLEWMGFRVVSEYDRPESISAKDVVRLLQTGRDRRVVAVVDNLQSGPDTGKSIAESLGRPHVVLTNFPTDRGYLATLKENVNTVLDALTRK